MILKARQNSPPASLRFHVGDAVEFCASCPERFDVVLLLGVLAHLQDQDAVFAGAKRVLTPRGRLIVVSPHPWGPLFWLRRLLDGGRTAPPPRPQRPSETMRKIGAAHDRGRAARRE